MAHGAVDTIRMAELWMALMMMGGCLRGHVLDRKKYRKRLAAVGADISPERLSALEEGEPPDILEARAALKLAKKSPTFFDEAFAPDLRLERSK